MAFRTNVFVNCPFDSGYIALLRPILFCVMYLGLQPRIALERLNSGETRVSKIIELVEDSKFAIHDLSRIKAGKKGEYFRLNMPFELGLDVGCMLFKEGRWASKKCLILEAEKYRYQAAISDLSNSDIAVHHNEPLEAMTCVRNWLAVEAKLKDAPGATAVWGAFNEFMADNQIALTKRGYTIDEVDHQPVAELLLGMRDWIGEKTGRR